jgi:hypothetical protein
LDFSTYSFSSFNKKIKQKCHYEQQVSKNMLVLLLFLNMLLQGGGLAQLVTGLLLVSRVDGSNQVQLSCYMIPKKLWTHSLSKITLYSQLGINKHGCKLIRVVYHDWRLQVIWRLLRGSALYAQKPCDTVAIVVTQVLRACTKARPGFELVTQVSGI